MNGESFSNYFNYFTEIEEHFQRARGTSLFLLSPLDWALIETWKNSGVPLEAVLRGIDQAFAKWRAKKSRVQMVNSVAYCAQAVMAETQKMADNNPSRAARQQEAAPFPPEALRRHIEEAIAAIRATKFPELHLVADSLAAILEDLPANSADLESLEQHLSSLEQKLIAIIRFKQTDSEILEMRRRLDVHLRPWRSKMSAAQIAMLETQYLDRETLESSRLPRLSLFYVR